MKATALALALAISAVQTVGWAECCCILICKHQNQPCSDCKESTEAPAPAGCCSESSHQAPKEETRCAHVEPSSEVVSQPATLPPIDFTLVLELPALPLQPPPRQAGRAEDLALHSRGSPPLHLLYSVLLI